MKPAKLDTSGTLQPTTNPTTNPTQPYQQQLTIPPHHIQLQKHGLQFQSPHPLPLWKELTLHLQPPNQPPIQHRGIVIASDGNQQQGYTTLITFTQPLPQPQPTPPQPQPQPHTQPPQPPQPHPPAP